MRRTVMMVAVAILAAGAGAKVRAATLAGLRTGMTAAQVEAAAPMGFSLKFFGREAAGSAALVKDADIFATMAFCRGRLISISRSIDADNEWVDRVRAAVASRCQPTIVTRTDPWSGPGGGTVEAVIMRWSDSRSRYEVSLAPEGRDGRGTLRHNRGASESVFADVDNPCRTNGESKAQQ